MGIKFHCPNGHKLNVKSFLAGKKGVCPKCGIRLRIPTASEEGAADSDIGAAAVAAGAAAGGANGSGHAMPGAVAAPRAVGAQAFAAPVVPAGMPIPSRPEAPVQNIPVGTPAMNVAPAMPLPGVAVPVIPSPAAAMPVAAVPTHRTAMAAMPTMPAMPSMPLPGAAMPLPPAVAAGDPIAEAPAATWYVRPPSGGQYGPARGDVMRKWLAEGRVSGDSLVWREGWADWKNAGQLFPHLAAAASTAGPLASIPVTPSSARSASRYRSQKKSGNGMAIAFLVVLAIVCVVLVGVLVYVLMNVK